jgi:hypothetical protein
MRMDTSYKYARLVYHECENYEDRHVIYIRTKELGEIHGKKKGEKRSKWRKKTKEGRNIACMHFVPPPADQFSTSYAHAFRSLQF